MVMSSTQENPVRMGQHKAPTVPAFGAQHLPLSFLPGQVGTWLGGSQLPSEREILKRLISVCL